MVIQGARSNERRMRAIGFPTYRYKLVCFVFAGMLCGLAGVLLANHTDFISPALMHWTRSGDLIVMAVLGGMGTVFGPVIGAVALLVLEEDCSPGITEYWQIILGPLFLLVVLFARGGIDGLLAEGAPWLTRCLEIDGLSKRFGGVVASDAIALAVPQGELHAIIGPNGAGKTTLIGQLAGEIVPDAGRIRFDGRDITALPIFRRSQLGLARSFQITSLFPDFTALDNVALAVQAHAGHSFRFWRDARSEPELRDAGACGARAGRTCRRAATSSSPISATASTASSRSRWRLPRRRACSCSTSRWPGWGRTRARAWSRLLRELKRELTILLIEHDMEAVFALADRITVLVYGRIIASGTPEAIRANAEVRQAYLGEQEAASWLSVAARGRRTSRPATA